MGLRLSTREAYQHRAHPLEQTRIHVGLASYIQSDIILMLPKSLHWLGDSRRQICEFPEDARQRAGFELWEVQQGKEPSDWKPMVSVGPGVKEIRIHCESEYRVLYVAKFEEAVYVLHVFQKTTQRTPKRDIEIASIRYRALTQQQRKR